MKPPCARLRRVALLLIASACWISARPATGQPAPGPVARRVESVVDRDGRRVVGRVGGEAAKGFVFTPEGGGAPIPLAKVGEVAFEGGEAPASAAVPPFHVLLGRGQRISGRLGGVGDDAILVEDGPSGLPVRVARRGALILLQRPGEVQVLRDGFEAIDPARWTSNGLAELDEHTKFDGARSLLLPAGGASLTCKLAEPTGSGRLELAYFDAGARVENQRWFVDLAFRAGANEVQSVRSVLGWSDANLAVESPGGPTLAVQPLARRPGWHRLVVRFDARRTDLSVDGDELAHGAGPGGPLAEIRLASQTVKGTDAPDDLAAHLDDLRLVRLTEPTETLQVDPNQDEVRLVSGDQDFGQVRMADADHVVLASQGKMYEYAWSEVAGLRFRRDPMPSEPLDGLLVRLEWRPGPIGDSQDLDRVEGVLAAVTDAEFTLKTPYAGELRVPRGQARRLAVFGPTHRIVLDPYPHHLGDRFDEHLDPPQDEGGTLTLDFDLPAPPKGRAALVLDVVQVVGESGNPDFSEEVKAGFLRTNASLNDKPFDYLNRHIASRNEAPERIRLPIPDGLLRPGSNRLRLDQTASRKPPEKRDNLGILGIALEFGADPPGEGPRP